MNQSTQENTGIAAAAKSVLAGDQNAKTSLSTLANFVCDHAQSQADALAASVPEGFEHYRHFTAEDDFPLVLQEALVAASGKRVNWSFLPASEHNSGFIGFMPAKAADKDAAFEVLTGHLQDYLDEASKDELFCGCVIDEQRDPENKLLSVRLVLCDNILGNAARRV